MPGYAKVAWAVFGAYLRAPPNRCRFPVHAARLAEAVRRMGTAAHGIDVADGAGGADRARRRRPDCDWAVHEPGGVHRIRRDGGGVLPSARSEGIMANCQRR